MRATKLHISTTISRINWVFKQGYYLRVNQYHADSPGPSLPLTMLT